MFDLTKRMSEGGARNLAIVIQCLCVFFAALAMMDLFARCVGSEARFFPQLLTIVRVPAWQAAAQGGGAVGFSQVQGVPGLTINLAELILLLLAGLFVGFAKWQHAAAASHSEHPDHRSRKPELARRAFMWAQVDIYSTLLAAVVGGYMLFTGLDRFLEVHARMGRNIELATRTLTELNSVHVNVDSMRTEFVEDMKRHKVSASEANRQFDRIYNKIDDLGTRRVLQAVDSLRRDVRGASATREAGSGEMAALRDELAALRASVERIEERLQPEHVGPGPR